MLRRHLAPHLYTGSITGRTLSLPAWLAVNHFRRSAHTEGRISLLKTASQSTQFRAYLSPHLPDMSAYLLPHEYMASCRSRMKHLSEIGAYS
jgi:hypothetical protein